MALPSAKIKAASFIEAKAAHRETGTLPDR
jgi:hypothetical protein